MELDKGKGSNSKVMTEVSGEIDQILHYNDNGGFFVAMLINAGNRNIKVLGTSATMPPVGSFMTALGQWQRNPNPQYANEMQFKVQDFNLSMPKDVNGVIKLLTGLKGIGDVRAHRIVDRLGENALEQILSDYHCIVGISSIGETVAQRAAESLKQVSSDADVESILAKIGLGAKARKAILAEKSAESILAMIEKDPYKLTSLPRATFQKVDHFVIVTKRVEASSVRRGAAVAIESLRRYCSLGHTFASLDQLVKSAKKLDLTVPISPRAIELGVQYAMKDGMLVSVGNGRVALPSLADAENDIASILKQWMSEPFELGSVRSVGAMFDTLTAEQKQAVINAISHRVSIITGGPGTGKTHVSRAVLAAMSGSNVFIVAPTGKAACRAHQLTKVEASTIHRFLGKVNVALSPRDDESPSSPEQVIPQVVLVDETSMVDTELFAELLRTLNKRQGARLIIVGDVDQLPSIGAGRVLADLIESNAIPVVRLTQVQRQKGDSTIIANAYKINQAVSEEAFSLREAADFVIVEHNDPKIVRARMVEYIAQRLTGEGYDVIEQVQVLSGQRKHELGTGELNRAIRQALNPPAPSKPELVGYTGESLFRVGDKVMVTVNNYTLGVVNGDQGIVIAVQKADKEHKESVTVRFKGEEINDVIFEDDDLETLTQAWAITTHKSQGSEYPVVLVVCHHELSWALQRALLYTAVTRGKERVVVFGTRDDIRKAALSENMERYTRLSQLLYAKKHA